MALVPISMLSKINDAIAAALKRKLDANGVRNDATTTDAGYVLDHGRIRYIRRDSRPHREER